MPKRVWWVNAQPPILKILRDIRSRVWRDVWNAGARELVFVSETIGLFHFVVPFSIYPLSVNQFNYIPSEPIPTPTCAWDVLHVTPLVGSWGDKLGNRSSKITQNTQQATISPPLESKPSRWLRGCFLQILLSNSPELDRTNLREM